MYREPGGERQQRIDDGELQVPISSVDAQAEDQERACSREVKDPPCKHAVGEELVAWNCRLEGTPRRELAGFVFAAP